MLAAGGHLDSRGPLKGSKLQSGVYGYFDTVGNSVTFGYILEYACVRLDTVGYQVAYSIIARWI